MAYWLLKTEPETFSLDDLKRDKTTPWNGVRNFQARNYIRSMKPGDKALIYHSGKNPAVVGIGMVNSTPYPEKTEETSKEWTQIDVQYVDTLASPVSLEKIKAEKKLADIKLLKQSRLSIVPLSKDQFDLILKLS